MTKEEARKEFKELLEIQDELMHLRQEQKDARDNTEFDSEIEEQERDRSEDMRLQFVDRYKHFLEKYDAFKNEITGEDYAERIPFGKEKFTKEFGIREEKESILLNETQQEVSRRNAEFPKL